MYTNIYRRLQLLQLHTDVYINDALCIYCVFAYLCICVFVYLCICVFVYLCICVAGEVRPSDSDSDYSIAEKLDSVSHN